MSVDLRLRHDRLLREQVVEMFERGFGYGLTVRRPGSGPRSLVVLKRSLSTVLRTGMYDEQASYLRCCTRLWLVCGSAESSLVLRYRRPDPTPLSAELCDPQWVPRSDVHA